MNLRETCNTSIYPNGLLEIPSGVISIIEIEPFEIGFERLKRAELEEAEGLHIYPYTNAHIEIRQLDPLILTPSTYYASYERLDFLRGFRDDLGSLGIDLFNLPGIVYFWNGFERRALIPPFVEIYTDPLLEWIQTNALLDGAHRSTIAGAAGVDLQCTVISHGLSDPSFLPYGVPTGWNVLNFVNGNPPTSEKRRYRRPNKPYSYMRPLRSMLDPNKYDKWADYGRVG